jgi:hypothetical protein
MCYNAYQIDLFRALLNLWASPKIASGGQQTDTDVDEFLSVGGSGREFEGLRELLRAKEERDTR